MARTLDMAVRRMEETNKQQTNSFNHRVDDMEDKIFQRLSRIEDKQTEIQENVSDLHVRCETLAAQNDDLQRDVDFLKRKNDYMENQSRRNNLVFIGIPPSRNKSESWQDCEAKVLDVIYNGMYIEEDIQIERAHRVGKAVVAKFLSYRQKTLVLSHARDLKNTRDYSRVFVREDFSQPVREQRKKLAQLQRQLRQRGHNPKLRFDKLLDDGALYTVGADGQIVEQQRWARRGGGRSEYGAWSGDDGRAEGHQWSQGYDALGDDAPGAWNQDWGGGYDLRGNDAQWPRLEQRREGERGLQTKQSRQAGGTGGTSTLKDGGPQRLQYDGRRAAPGQHMQTGRKELPSTAHSAPHEHKQHGKHAYYRNGGLVVRDEEPRRQRGGYRDQYQPHQRHHHQSHRMHYDDDAYDDGRRNELSMQRSTDHNENSGGQQVSELPPLPTSSPFHGTQSLTHGDPPDHPPSPPLSLPREMLSASQATAVANSQALTVGDEAMGGWSASGGGWDTAVSQQLVDYDVTVDNNNDDDFPTSAQPWGQRGGVPADNLTPSPSAGSLRGFGRGSPLPSSDDNAVPAPSHVAAGRAKRLSGRAAGSQASTRLTRSMSVAKGQSKLPDSWSKTRGGADGDHGSAAVTATLPVEASSTAHSPAVDETD
jgi:hypothetical protein